MNNLFSTDEVYLILMRYHERIQTEKKWDTFLRNRKKQILPYSNEIKSMLAVDDWSIIKSHAISLLDTHPSFAHITDMNKKIALIDIAMQKMFIIHVVKPYREHVQTIRMYNDFRNTKQHEGLPHSQSIIKAFGSWNTFKQAAGLEVYEQGRPVIYTDEQLLNLLDKYAEHFTTTKEWNDFILTQDEEIPSFQWFISRLPRSVINQYRNRNYYDVSDEEIRAAIKNHLHILPQGILIWNEYARVNKLPSYQTLKRKLSADELNNLMIGKIE